VEYRLANDLNKPAEKISWLKKLVSACHERGIHVIMDGVFNHVSTDFPYKMMYRNPQACPYTGDFGGTFPGLQDLNFNNACTQEFVRDVCLYWIDTFKIDGIRLDNTVNFHVAGETKGLSRLLDDIHGHLDEAGEENFSLTLEHLNLDAANLTNTTRATSYWDNALYARCYEYLWNGRIDSRFLNTLNNRRYLHWADKIPTSYLGNHDHAHVAWQAGARDNVGSMKWYKTQPYVIALYTCTSTPMIQNGQEFAEDHWMPEDDHGTGRRVIPRPLRWKLMGDRIGSALRNLYRRMAEIRSAFSVLRTGAFDPDYWEEWQTQGNSDGYGVDVERQMVIYRRWGHDDQGKLQNFIIVLNFSDYDHLITLRLPESGVWTDLLSGYNGAWKPQVHNNRLTYTATSNWGQVFFKEAE
jgi:1,4-alpha-glucan branching enzyme